MDYKEWLATVASVPVGIWRALSPRRIADDFVTYAVDGMDWFEPAAWRLEVTGEVEEPQAFTWDAFQALAHESRHRDFHCISGWSVLDAAWSGVPWTAFVKHCRPLPTARYVRFVSHGDYAASFAVGDLEEALLADGLNDAALPPERGGPLRLVAPGFYGYKSVKGLRRIEFLRVRRLGLWEIWGYGPSGRIGSMDRARIERLRNRR